MTRPRTLSVLQMSREHVVGQVTTFDESDRPRTRRDCEGGERPCPWVACKHHLYIDVDPRLGSLKYNFPHLEVDELKESCSLDVAARGGITLEEAGAAINVTRERVRQIEELAFETSSKTKIDIEDIPDRGASAPSVATGDAVVAYHAATQHTRPSRALFRCSVCAVRVEWSTMPYHGCVDAQFTPDDSVQKPVGRPDRIEMYKLIARRGQ